MITYCTFQVGYAMLTQIHLQIDFEVHRFILSMIIKPRPPFLPKMTYISKEIDDFPL